MVENAAVRPEGSAVQATGSKRVVLYAGVGPELIQYDVDVDCVALVKRGSVRLPGNVQYAWPHASKQYFYVVSSDEAANKHHINAFRVDQTTGALQPHGQPVTLRRRPIHVTTDIPSEHALVVYADRSGLNVHRPSGLTVHRINRDGTLGKKVTQPESLDLGFFAHQIRVAPSNTMAILVTRGPRKPEGPGALKVFKYRGGVLSEKVSITPEGGHAFEPRHLDFHPSKPWFYVLLERQHKICVFTLDRDPLSSEPLFSKDTLTEPGVVRPRQFAGAVHVHPNGRIVYASERADGTAEVNGERVFVGGENTILAYAIDQRTGEPRLTQRVDTRGMHPRTFAIDQYGRILVAANIAPVPVQDGNTLRIVPASLDVFRMDANGKLDYVRKYDVDVGSDLMFWMGMITL